MVRASRYPGPMPLPPIALSPTLRELSGPDVALGYTAMHELRGHRPPLATPEVFVDWVATHAAEGYRLVGAFLPDEAQAAAVAGFRPMTLLYAGRTLYIDDLSTRAAHRGQGLGPGAAGLGGGRGAAAGLRAAPAGLRGAALPGAPNLPV